MVKMVANCLVLVSPLLTFAPADTRVEQQPRVRCLNINTVAVRTALQSTRTNTQDSTLIASHKPIEPAATRPCPPDCHRRLPIDGKVIGLPSPSTHTSTTNPSKDIRRAPCWLSATKT